MPSRRGRHGGTRSVNGSALTVRNPGNPSATVKGGVVYFVAAPSTGQVKIGRTKSFHKRFAALQAGSPIELEKLGTIPGGAAVELYLHASFIGERQHGEWFNLTDEIRQVAATGNLPPASNGIALGALAADGPLFRRLALVEQAIALGLDAPKSVAATAGCTPDELADAVLMMRAFGFLRGSRSPSTEIRIVAA